MRISLLATLISVTTSLTIASAQPKQLREIASLCAATFEDISGFGGRAAAAAGGAGVGGEIGRAQRDRRPLSARGDRWRRRQRLPLRGRLLPPPPLADAPLDGRVPPDEPYIANVAVAAAARCQGVGRALIDEAERRVCEAGYNRLFVKVDCSNLRRGACTTARASRSPFQWTKRAEMKLVAVGAARRRSSSCSRV